MRDKAAYISPTEPLEDQKTRRDIGLVGKYYGNPTLVVLDGVTECMMLHGWDPNVGTDVAKFLEFYPRRMASTGAALIFIDHVSKSKGSHERYAIGSGPQAEGHRRSLLHVRGQAAVRTWDGGRLGCLRQQGPTGVRPALRR